MTGRNRRCGWLDLVALRYAVRVNGIDGLALTKLDVLSHFAELRCARATAVPAAARRASSPRTRATSTRREPVYETLPGWEEPLDACGSRRRAARDAARRYVEVVERELDVEVTLIGTGADRERVLTPRGVERADRRQTASAEGPRARGQREASRAAREAAEAPARAARRRSSSDAAARAARPVPSPTEARVVEAE